MRWLAVLLLAGCECAVEPPPRASPDPAAAPAQLEGLVAPRLVVEGLDRAPPLTRVERSVRAVLVTNARLVATWPPEALAARPHDADPTWPRVAAQLAPTDADGLTQTLSRARAASGGGTRLVTRLGADVPFADVEATLAAIARAGYATPWIALGSRAEERVLPWPSAPRDHGLTEADLRAALEGAPLPSAPEDASARLTLRDDATECADPCLDRLRAEAPILTVAVAPDVAFGPVAETLQRATARFDRVRVVRAPP